MYLIVAISARSSSTLEINNGNIYNSKFEWEDMD